MTPKEKGILILVLAFMLHIGMGLYQLGHQSLTVNEPIYMMAGYYYLTEGETFQTGHPQLTHVLAAVPLLFLPVDAPDPTTIEHAQEYARTEWLYYEDNDLATILFWARIPFLLLSFLCAYFVFRWTKELFGLLPAAIALCIYILHPDIRWMSTVVMTDLAVATFMLISCYYLWKYLKEEERKYLWLWGIFFGLALTSKSTALFALPIYGAILLVHQGTQIKKILTDISVGVLIAIVVFGIVGIADFNPIYDTKNPFYAKSGQFRSEERLQQLTEDFTANTLLQDALKFGLKDIPVPGASSLAAYATQFKHTVGGHSQYFMGSYTNHGIWYYYVFLYLIKTPIALLALFCISLLLFTRLRAKQYKDELTLILPAVIFLFISSFIVRLNLGLRHTLIVFLFLIVFSAKVFQFKKYDNRIIPIIIICLLGWYAFTTITIAPSYIAYFNEFVTPEKAPLYVIDDSIDWGQDLINLKYYMQDHDIESIKLRYAGFEKPEYRNITYEKLGCEPTEGILAVSVNALYGGRFWYEGTQRIDRECYAWLRAEEPIDRIGYSIYVYNITET